MCCAQVLTGLFMNNLSSRRFKAPSHYKYSPSEIDYIIKYASILVQNIFSGISDVSVDWDTTSNALKESIPRMFKSIRPDLVIFSVKGVEVGCGEIKPHGKGKELVDNDRARMAEICKRQLHINMVQNHNQQAFKTFGILLAGYQLELTCLEYVNGEYNYSTMADIKLFGRDTMYHDIENALIALLSFKNLISTSTTGDNSGVKFNSFENLKPTLRFLEK